MTTTPSLFLLVLLLQLISNLHADWQANSERSWQYCIVGAGPAGLQMGFFLDRAGRDYVIMERANISGAFFATYPRHRKLISINKRHTGKTNKEFNLRHDWNSLLSDDESLQMKYYSKEFFPNAGTYVQYLNDYTRKLRLNVKYSVNVQNITRASDSKKFKFVDQHGYDYSCRVHKDDDISEVSAYLESKQIAVHDLVKKCHSDAKFNSFKLVVSKSDDSTKITDPQFWPRGIYVRRWCDKPEEGDIELLNGVPGDCNNDDDCVSV